MFGNGATKRTSSVAPLRSGFRPVEHAFSILRTDSSRCRRKQLWNAHEIVGRGGEDEEPFDEATPAMTRLAQRCHRLHPAEGLLDALAFDLADGIARVTGRAAVDGRTPVGVILRDVGRAAAFAAASDKVRRVVVLVGANRAWPLASVRRASTISPLRFSVKR